VPAEVIILGMSDQRLGALLCDIDGVLRHWDWAATAGLERAFGVPAGAIAEAAFARDRLMPAITGLISDERWRADIAGDLGRRHGSTARAAQLVERWSEDVGRIDAEVLALLVAAQRTIPVVLVSNATTRLERDLERLGVADAIARVVNSCRIGSAKPDQAIYRAAAERAGVPASRCLFVDDTAGHVRAAEAAGMAGLVYRDAAELRRVLGPALG
jgi:putative hydrolase of the HAD superfamily